jgi:hypothetical protein
MQKAQSECDLLECSGGDRSDENAARQMAFESRNIDAALEAGIECAMRERGNRDAGAHRFEGTHDATRMPFAAPFFYEKRQMQFFPLTLRRGLG